MMFLRRWISALRERIRAFLGIDVLPTRSETIALRDEIQKNHREVLEVLAKIAVFRKYPTSMPSPGDFRAPILDWETVQKIQLADMLENPPKED